MKRKVLFNTFALHCIALHSNEIDMNASHLQMNIQIILFIVLSNICKITIDLQKFVAQTYTHTPIKQLLIYYSTIVFTQTFVGIYIQNL